MTVRPDYKKSIVNLMASIGGAYGVKTGYAPLKMLPAAELKKAKSVVLLVIDGLGAEFVRREARTGGVFEKHKRGEITSVFPPTTTAAITTFLTGRAPQEHGWISWFMNVKELGGPIISLPLLMRGNKEKIKVDVNQFFNLKAITEKMKTSSYAIVPQKIAKAEFNKKFSKKAKLLGYKEDSLKGWLYQMRRAIKKRGKKYIYSYWPGFDTIAHDDGANSRKGIKHFKKIEKELEGFVKSIKGTDTILLITADHGLIDHPKKEEIILNEDKRFYDCLSAPVFGEKRAAFCNVRLGKAGELESYVRRKMNKYCELVKSEKLIEKGYFGLGKEHEKLRERIGDYTLLAKGSYVFRDFLLTEKVKYHVGDQGGLSREEMMVPLVVVKC